MFIGRTSFLWPSDVLVLVRNSVVCLWHVFLFLISCDCCIYQTTLWWWSAVWIVYSLDLASSWRDCFRELSSTSRFVLIVLQIFIATDHTVLPALDVAYHSVSFQIVSDIVACELVHSTVILFFAWSRWKHFPMSISAAYKYCLPNPSNVCSMQNTKVTEVSKV